MLSADCSAALKYAQSGSDSYKNPEGTRTIGLVACGDVGESRLCEEEKDGRSLVDILRGETGDESRLLGDGGVWSRV